MVLMVEYKNQMTLLVSDPSFNRTRPVEVTYIGKDFARVRLKLQLRLNIPVRRSALAHQITKYWTLKKCGSSYSFAVCDVCEAELYRRPEAS